MAQQSFELFEQDVIDENQCIDFASDLNFAYLRDMPSAADATARFRHRLEHGGLPYDILQRGYFLPIRTIQYLLGQNEGKISGLKIYFGETPLSEGKIFLDLIIVATHQVGTRVAVDFNIPQIPSILGAVLGNGRPCPSECGTRNCLNHL